MRRAWETVLLAAIATVASAHIGSPDVFFSGMAGPYDVRVVVRPPEVVPGIARVTVRTMTDVERVSIRPVYWRAGSRGAPSADDTRRMEGDARTFAGSLWLMARGAYTVEVIVDGALGPGTVQVPVASVATGQLAMGPGLGALLVVLALILVAGLVTIVYKSAGESLTEPGRDLDAPRRRRARVVAAVSLPIIALGLLGGARWWRAVDAEYDRTIYRPSPLVLSQRDGLLHVAASDTVWQPPGRPSALVPDHGKPMHLFLVRTGDAGALAHLHPQATDSSAIPAMVTRVPPLPAGQYHVYGDVVHETGFERTLVGTLSVDPGDARGYAPLDPDDAWFAGAAARGRSARLADGSEMHIELLHADTVVAGAEESIRVSVRDTAGRPVPLESYLGMQAHGVVVRVDGTVYVHLHPMGTVTTAAQQAFLARDRGDTTETGRLRPSDHAMHQSPAASVTTEAVTFPYAFPRAGDYRLFVQVKRGGRVLTGAFAIPVSDSTSTR